MDLKKAVTELAKTQAEDALLTSLDLIALVKLRLAEQGTRADGSNFSDYSPIYSKTRQKKGLQVDKKDFNVTGQLYASMKPELTAEQIGRVEVKLTVRGSDNQMKVIGQMKREGGSILEPSPDELREAAIAQTRRRVKRLTELLR